MWIKEEITFAKDAQGKPVFIVPTDDLRLKFVIFESPEVPTENLATLCQQMLP